MRIVKFHVMVKTLLFDFSRVLLHPRNKNYKEGLNALHKKLSEDRGYYIFNHFELNDGLLKYIKGLKDSYGLYVLTTDMIQDDPAVRKIIDPLFKKVFSTRQIGFSKREVEAYKFIVKKLRQNPGEILFIDDTLANIEAAKMVGLKTVHFVSNEDLFKKLNEILK